MSERADVHVIKLSTLTGDVQHPTGFSKEGTKCSTKQLGYMLNRMTLALFG